jgi:hypothetical protein
MVLATFTIRGRDVAFEFAWKQFLFGLDLDYGGLLVGLFELNVGPWKTFDVDWFRYRFQIWRRYWLNFLAKPQVLFRLMYFGDHLCLELDSSSWTWSGVVSAAGG